MGKTFDFAGWATRANMRCSDGRIIMKDAFKDCDGKQVPLVWNHRHNDPDNILGYAVLHSVNGDVRAECYFNSTERGQTAKELVGHGDINQLSIYANQLKESGKNVIHGIIREVSLVLAGANPGAFIDSVVAHNDDGTVIEDREQGILFTGETIELYHADNSDEKEESSKDEDKNAESKDETIRDIYESMNEKQQNVIAILIDQATNPSSDDKEEESVQHADEGGETIRDIFNTMTDKQKVVAMALIEEAIKNSDTEDEESEEEETNMKHNVFDQETDQGSVLTHADGVEIINLAKSYGGGSLKAAIEAYIDNNDSLSHTAADNIQNISQLFPEYKDVKPGAPELLTTDQGWITKVLAQVHKSPISRIRTRQADVRDISNRRAKGYTKGAQKTDAGDLPILSRTTDPVTVYIRSKLDRDDIIDITDFDIVQYMYNLDRMNLNEELARQITIGDGRSGDGAIDPTKIRPIWTDDELYCIHRAVDIDSMREELTGTNSTANFGENYVYAESVIQSLLYAREKYKGSGNPVFMCTPHLVNVMLLARDLNGRRIYDNVNELKAALNVREIITAEQFADKTRKQTISAVEHTFELLGLLVNFSDYSLGATKGGEITHFTDFDLNFNQEVSLLETRCSGALTRPFSAIALEIDVTGNP